MSDEPTPKRGRIRVLKSTLDDTLRFQMRSEAGGTILAQSLTRADAVPFIEEVLENCANLLTPLPVPSRFQGSEFDLQGATARLHEAVIHYGKAIAYAEELLARENARPSSPGRFPGTPPPELCDPAKLRELAIFLDNAGVLRAFTQALAKTSEHALRARCPKCTATYMREKTSGIRLCPVCEAPVDARGNNDAP